MNGVTVNAMDEVLTHMKVVLSLKANGKIAKHMNELSIPTARGGKWHGKTVLNAHQRLR